MAPARTGLPPVDGHELLAIFAGGCVGTLARYGLDEGLAAGPAEWPWATFVANVVGAFVLGYVATHLHERVSGSDYRRPLLTTGFCGALTTFSTLQLELLRMLDHGEVGLAVAYVTASLVAGLAAVVLGTRIVRAARATA